MQQHQINLRTRNTFYPQQQPFFKANLIVVSRINLKFQTILRHNLNLTFMPLCCSVAVFRFVCLRAQTSTGSADTLHRLTSTCCHRRGVYKPKQVFLTYRQSGAQTLTPAQFRLIIEVYTIDIHRLPVTSLVLHVCCVLIVLFFTLKQFRSPQPTFFN